jgi:intracellular sulfur oxidation DsrE/DsrF family protein
MLRQFALLALACLALGAFAYLMLPDGRDAESRPQNVTPAAQPYSGVSPPQERQAGLVADISVHTEADLEALLERVEQLLRRPRKAGEAPLVSLVLHGPEVEFFALKNYAQYRAVVDHAAKLAALGAVDISICQTQMRNLGIGTDQVPAFLRQVPYGPGEVERLLKDGFVYM